MIYENRTNSIFWNYAPGSPATIKAESRLIYRDYLRGLLRALRTDKRLTIEEFYQLLQLADTIIDYGRMIQAYHQLAGPNVLVEVSELARRLRETPRTIKNALLLLQDMRRAHPARLGGCWEVQLVEDKRDDLGAA
jgi:hypothetical protein